MNEGMDTNVSLDQPVSQDVNVQQPAQDMSANSAPKDEYVPKSRVQEIVHERTRHAAQNAYERGLKEAEQRRPAGMGMGGMAEVDEGKLKSMMADVFRQQHAELQRDYEQQELKRQLDHLANDYMGKLQAAKDKYPDLEKRRDELGELATLVPYINETDNVAGVTQHLLDNGHNVASLLVLSHTSPNFLRRELKKLADSIKLNEDARTRQYPNEPLSSVTPSIPKDSDSGSIEALKRQSWLRG